MILGEHWVNWDEFFIPNITVSISVRGLQLSHERDITLVVYNEYAAQIDKSIGQGMAGIWKMWFTVPSFENGG